MKGNLASSFPERDLSQERLSRPDLEIKQIQVDFKVENRASTIGLWSHNYQKTQSDLNGECLQKQGSTSVTVNIFWSGGKARKMKAH